MRRLAFIAILLAVLCVFAACGEATQTPPPVPEQTLVPILLYHHFGEEVGESTVTEELFREHVAALMEAGFTPVSVEDVIAYAAEGTPLPRKPVLFMSDDGYASALAVAMPILSEFSAPLTVAVIGCSFGKDTYKDTDMAMIPHFGAEEAKIAMESGLLSLVSHSWDLHMVGRDALETPALFRKGALRRDGESLADYEAALLADGEKMEALLRSIGGRSDVFAYPYGLWSEESEEILRKNGVICTMTTESAVAVLRAGDAESLRLLPRFTVTAEMTAEELLRLIEGDGKPSHFSDS